MSQNARDLYSRFSHLLQPIRDLTKNWDVDVASQLEEYMEEIEHITISFDDGTTSMNFAEAALLIQGSTCVYSKKVEYLYALVFQTLDLIASKRKLAQVSSVDDQGKDSDVSFAHRKDQDEFLCLDMVESANIDLDEMGGRQLKKASTIPRTPMSLIPLQDLERASSTPLLSEGGEVLGSRVDFKMNTSVVHATGALLLEPVNQLVFNVKMVNSKEPIPITFDTPSEKIKEMLHSSVRTPIPLRHEDGDAMCDEFDGDYMYGDAGGEDDGDTQRPALAEIDTNMTDVKQRPTRVCLQSEEKPSDPWVLLDPHDKGSTADNKPFRKGISYKVLPSLVKEKTRKRKTSGSCDRDAPAESLSRFIHRSIYSCSSMFPKNALKAPQSSEFEGHYWAEMKKRLKQKQQDNIKLVQLNKEHALLLEQEAVKEEDEDNVEDYHPLGGGDDSDPEPGEPYVGDGLESGFEGAFNNYAASDRDCHGNIITMATNGDADYQGIEPMVLEELSAGRVETQHLNYEDLVRNYVESTMEGVQAYVQETELSKRVQQWEAKIRPVLATEEQYPVFDIHSYGARLMDQIQRHKESGSSDHVYFRDVMRNEKHYEVSRMFAATLQLANDCNVRIECAGEGEGAVDTMSLTLLSTQLHHKAIPDYQAPSLHTATAI